MKKLPKKNLKKKKLAFFRFKGSGNVFFIILLALLIFIAFTAIGGIPHMAPVSKDRVVIVVTPTNEPARQNLQLRTFGYITPLPTPTSAPGGSLCTDKGVNTEPEILVGYSPAAGQSVASTGQIKVWVNDEGAPFIAPNEQVDLTTGAVTAPGDRSAKAADGYLYEPAIYISPATAESGGAAHFPNYVKGDFNNKPPTRTSGQKGAVRDPLPANTVLYEEYTAEFIWDVSSLGVGPGNYQAEFVIHDGDRDRGVGCINFTVN